MHPRAGRLRQPRHAIRFEGTPIDAVTAAPELAEHTVEILDELGLSESEMHDLAAQGVLG